MKKVLVFLSVLAVVAGSAWADEPSLSWGAWGRGVFVPYASNSESGDTATVIGPAWTGTNLPRVGFSITGKSDDIGFAADLTADATTFGIGDNAKVWAKPFSFLKLTVGKFNEDDLRGKIGGSIQPVTMYNASGDEDTLFRRFQENPGIHLALTPIEGLYVGWGIQPHGTGWTAASGYDDGNFGDAIKYSQIGAGYQIAGIGHIRAQLDNRDSDKDNDNGIIRVAFALTAIDSLTVDAGVQVYADNDDDDASDDTSIAVAANYGSASKQGGIAARARVLTILHEEDSFFGIYAGGEFGFSDSVGLGADVSYGVEGKTSNFGLTGWVRKTLAKGSIVAGLTAQIPTGEDNKEAGTNFAVPVAFTYSF